MPRFSVVVPATRAHYVGGALRSVLAQTFDDFEIVLSDNSSGQLDAVLAEFDDRRLRVVRPPRSMTVSAHWDFAFSHATGDWQLMLCDDDALVPEALGILDRLVRENPWTEAVRWRHAGYRHDGAIAGELLAGAPSGICTREQSGVVLAEIFAEGTIPGRLKERVPNIPLATMSAALVARVRKASRGPLFIPFDPMTSQCMLTMACTKEHLLVDLPLTLLGLSDDSAGSSAAQAGQPDSAFERTNGDSAILYAPIKSRRLLCNLKSDTMLSLLSAYPEMFGRYQMGWDAYFYYCRSSIDEMADLGIDMSAEARMYSEALGTFPAEVAAGVQRRRSAVPAASGGASSLWTAAKGLISRTLMPARAVNRYPTIDAAAIRLGESIRTAIG